MTEIFELIDANDAQGVLALLARVPEQAAARDEEDLTAVRRAAYRSPELLDAVTSANPPLDGFDAATSPEDGFTPLHLAACGRQAEAVRILLERGADPNVMSRHAAIRVRPLQHRSRIRRRRRGRPGLARARRRPERSCRRRRLHRSPQRGP